MYQAAEERYQKMDYVYCGKSGLKLPDGNSLVTRGTIEGYIGWEECGSNGFGYDPIFYLYENDKSTAELSAEEKNAISHRGKALRQMKKMLEEQK